MDFNTTIDIIIKDLREVREIIDDFKNYPGIPAIQVELAKSKCKSAEEIIAFLKTIKSDFRDNEAGKSDATGITESGRKVEIAGVDKINEDHQELSLSEPVGQTDLFEISDEDESVPSPEPDIQKKKNRSKGSVRVDSIFKDTGSVPRSKPEDKIIETNIIAEKYSEVSGTVHEQLGINKGEDDLSSVLNAMSITNLNEAIGVNDKFLFISEVFGGNQASYLEAIEKLNNTGNLTDAKAIIMSYTGDNVENEAVIQLLDLVKRKLASDE